MSDFGIWHDVVTDPPPENVPLLAFFVNACGMDRIVRAEYAAKHTLPLADELEGGCTCGEDGCGEDEVWCAEGWYESNEFDEYSYRVTDEVTHWMRLPSSPQHQPSSVQLLSSRYRQLAEAAHAVVMSMDRPVVGTPSEGAKAWIAAKRLCNILNQHHGRVSGSEPR